MESQLITIYTDAITSDSKIRENISGIAFVTIKNRNVVSVGAKVVKGCTRIKAEYKAAEHGIANAIYGFTSEPPRIELITTNKLLVKQLNGLAGVYDSEMTFIMKAITQLISISGAFQSELTTKNHPWIKECHRMASEILYQNLPDPDQYGG